jgi:hypothetical protein
MDEDEDDEPLRFLFASAFQHGGAADGCPEPEALVDALDQRTPADERALVIDHLAACPVCAEAWRLLVLERRRP